MCQTRVGLVNIIGRQRVSIHSAEMYLGFLQGLRDLANRYVAVAMQERALSQLVAGTNIDGDLQNAQLRSQVFGTTVRTNSEELMKAPAEDDGTTAEATVTTTTTTTTTESKTQQ